MIHKSIDVVPNLHRGALIATELQGLRRPAASAVKNTKNSRNPRGILRRFLAGDDPVFRVGMGYAPAPGSLFAPAGPQSPSPEVAMLVSIQTDYAGWHGAEVFNRSRAAK